jgi:hypothetical protein
MRTRTVKPVRSASDEDAANMAETAPVAVEWEDVEAAAEFAGAEDEAAEPETYDIFRVGCPDCAQPIALLDGEGRLPEHARCSSPWDPFGLTVCEGSGRPVDEAVARDGSAQSQEGGLAALLTLPEGLDWRMQPFSHPGDAGGDVERSQRRPRRQKAGRA